MGTVTTKPAANATAARNALGSATDTTSWSKSLLGALGAPATANNVSNVKLWLHQEQSPSSWASNNTNPLGVETGGSVKPTGSVLSGVLATANTLLANPQWYGGIVKSLRNNAPTPVFAQSVISSPWSGGTYKANGLGAFLGKGPLESGAANPTGWFGQWIEPVLQNPVPLPGLTKLPGGSTTPGGGVITNAVDSVPGVSGAISTASFLGKISNPNNLHNVGIFVAGLLVSGVGLMVLLSSTKVAGDAAAIGKVAA